MSEKIRYCRICGAKLSAGAKFCKACGTKITDTAGPSPAVVKPAKRTCPDCGNEVSDTARFCRKCGHKFEGAASASAPTITPAQARDHREAVKVVEALSQPGEFTLTDFMPEVLSDVSESVRSVKEVLAPFTAIGSGIKSFISGIFGIFKSPRNLIMTLALVALWTFLGMNRGSDAAPVRILSFLTFADGGFDRDAAGMIGGIIGKGAVGCMLASVFSGGIGKFAGGLGAMFRKTESKRSIIFMLLGLILGIGLYFTFVGGENASAATAMAGIAGAVLSLEALGSKEGCIYQIAEAFTSKKVDGVRMACDGKANSLLGGMTVGFAIITALSSLA